jgi:hypothetical protein
MEDAIQQKDDLNEEDLRGTLAHTSVVDLLQLLNTGGRTGELEVRSEGQADKATVYFAEGHMSHVAIGQRGGLDVLADLLRWEDGSFRFSPNVVCPTTSIDQTFQSAIMEAARRLDEETSSKASPHGGRVGRELGRFLAASDFATHAFLIGSDGSVLVSGTEREDELPWLDTFRDSLVQFIGRYPPRQLTRMIFDEAEQTLIVSCLDNGSALLVATTKAATLGSVMFLVDRLSRTVKELQREEQR